MMRIKNINKYNEDKIVILNQSLSNLFKNRGMEFFNHPSIPSLSFPCITLKRTK